MKYFAEHFYDINSCKEKLIARSTQEVHLTMVENEPLSIHDRHGETHEDPCPRQDKRKTSWTVKGGSKQIVELQMSRCTDAN